MEIRVLLRSLAELLYRTACIRAHIAQIRAGQAPEYEPLARTIESALAAIDAPVLKSIQAINQVKVDFVDALFSQLRTFSKHFSLAHELLVYFPSPGILPETKEMMRAVFPTQYDSLRPPVILGTLFNAFSFDFYENIKRVLPDFGLLVKTTEQNKVLQLPICDRLSPTGWAVLAHEMGHAIDLEYRITDCVAAYHNIKTTTNLFNWIRELCADLIAAEMLGPPAILAVVALEYTVYCSKGDAATGRWLHRPSKTHPCTKWRLHVIRKYLHRKHGYDYLAGAYKLYQSAWEFSVTREVTAGASRTDIIEKDALWIAVIERIIPSLLDEILKRCANPEVISTRSVARCVNRLRNGLPIGAQGIRRRRLQASLSHFFTRAADDRVAEFGDLLSRFVEAPLSIQPLLLSCFLHRECLMQDAMDAMERGHGDQALEIIRTLVRQQDSLAIKSITIGMVHKLMESVPDGR